MARRTTQATTRRFVGMDELAALLECSRRTLDRVIANNELAVTPISDGTRRRRRWDRQEVIEAIAAKRIYVPKLARGRRVRSRGVAA